MKLDVKCYHCQIDITIDLDYDEFYCEECGCILDTNHYEDEEKEL